MELIESAPAWLRPGLYGALFVFGLMFARGLVFILPIALLVLAFTHPEQIPKLLAGILVVVPIAGFLGGIAYSLVGQLAGRIGKTGQVLQYVAAAWVYCMLLVFIIMPWLDPPTVQALSFRANLVLASGMGVFFGLILGLVATGVVKA